MTHQVMFQIMAQVMAEESLRAQNYPCKPLIFPGFSGQTVIKPTDFGHNLHPWFQTSHSYRKFLPWTLSRISSCDQMIKAARPVAHSLSRKTNLKKQTSHTLIVNQSNSTHMSPKENSKDLTIPPSGNQSNIRPKRELVFNNITTHFVGTN